MTQKLIRKEVTGSAVYIPGDDIDTDRIIPARFLKEITFENMGLYLFYDARFNEHNQPKSHPLNAPEAENAKFLIAGKNFGCGSSREHAPQAIMRFGIQAVIGESFAEIFSGNCKSLGIPCITASPSDLAELQKAVLANPALSLHLDIEHLSLVWQNRTISVSLPKERQHSFLSGQWNAGALLKANMDKINQTAQKLPYKGWKK